MLNNASSVAETRHRMLKALFWAITFTVCFVSVPWDEVRSRPFDDRLQYKNYFQFQESILDYKSFDSWSDYVTNEYLWHFGIRALLDRHIASLDAIFLVISLLLVGSAAVMLALRHRPAALLLLVNPLYVTLAFSQLRMALAIAILLIAASTKRLVVAGALVALATLVHTATPLFVALGLIAAFAAKRLTKTSGSYPWTCVAVLVFVGAAFGVITGPLLATILASLGDRRIAVYSQDTAESILFVSFWFVLTIALCLQRKEFFRDEIHCFALSLLTMATVTVATGGYTSRILAVAMPYSISAMLNTDAWFRIPLLVLFLVYACAQWFYWISF